MNNDATICLDESSLVSMPLQYFVFVLLILFYFDNKEFLKNYKIGVNRVHLCPSSI